MRLLFLLFILLVCLAQTTSGRKRNSKFRPCEKMGGICKSQKTHGCSILPAECKSRYKHCCRL
ncbi:beta-defensin 33 precursor [Mus musculus]|uniref:Beta-defensin 33 n=1 Tax=Mus musculus TaxID=10090 RepID=DFB33_MOUSE|nr:beta-defensin 33 precursor [Mus musculus]Q30KN3.1 RecName: Full=Beta-defensin 33; Short=BD-33; Short=mBD-33; AltName: Full=Defensin, beta 33; Flags: Precursor [Mus musculus]AAI45765.1 Predicted gene, EG654453 [Mus musculus]AAI45767.1 Predicted gene, EG654453 [Mus musculus]AAY59777.1 beta-defensin 33 [Mus musculus]|eukprot:NP_001034208.1 beta-defensin 33 precursor [Mus musculus]